VGLANTIEGDMGCPRIDSKEGWSAEHQNLDRKLKVERDTEGSV
jgi:hypothetical protein